MLLAVVLIGGWYLLWGEVRGHVLGSRDYLVAPTDVEIPPPPNWIRGDLRLEVFRMAGLEGPLHLVDEDLCARLAAAFALHPWVAKVHEVRKRYPAHVKVDLSYRQPLLVVETPGELLPVDRQGVLLPAEEFSPLEKARFPRLIGLGTAPLGTAGEPWGDPRVLGAAEIVDALGPAWNELKLDRIAASSKPISHTPEDYLYVLLTRGGTQIIWGRAPHIKAAGELTAAEKLRRLRTYVERHGTLEGRGGPQTLDVRDLAE
jgi:hypothetical protein